MVDFTLHDKQSAPEAARPLMEKAESKFGFVPNLVRAMAEAPAAAEGYMTLSGLFEKTGFSPVERQVILLAVSRENGCEYCMAAHSASAQMAGVPGDVVDALREDRPISDDKLEALRRFASTMVDKRGYPSDAETKAFLDAGYSKQNILEVILAIGMKTISNYANHVIKTPLDEPLKAAKWQAPKRTAAE